MRVATPAALHQFHHLLLSLSLLTQRHAASIMTTLGEGKSPEHFLSAVIKDGDVSSKKAEKAGSTSGKNKSKTINSNSKRYFARNLTHTCIWRLTPLNSSNLKEGVVPHHTVAEMACYAADTSAAFIAAVRPPCAKRRRCVASYQNRVHIIWPACMRSCGLPGWLFPCPYGFPSK